MSERVWLNGRLVAAERARVPAFDYGFLYGLGLFETMRACDAKVFRLERHLQRLAEGAHVLGLPPLPSDDVLRAAVSETLAANGLRDARVRLTVTAGPGAPLPDPSTCHKPTVLLVARPHTQQATAGCRALIASFPTNSASPLTRLKSTCYAPYLLARQKARARGLDEALLLNERGELAECSTSNLFLLKDGALLTPDVPSGVLPGVTREAVLELATALGMRAREERLSLDALWGCDEAFVTNSLIGIVPLLAVDGRALGAGGSGETTIRLFRAYEQLVRAETGAV